MAQKIELPKAQELFAPFKALNEMAMANAETLVSMQSKNFEKFSKLAIASVKEASQIADLEGSQAYFTKQSEVGKKAAEDLTADMKAIAEMGQAYAAEVQKVVSESMSKVGKAA